MRVSVVKHKKLKTEALQSYRSFAYFVLMSFILHRVKKRVIMVFCYEVQITHYYEDPPDRRLVGRTQGIFFYVWQYEVSWLG